MVHHGIKETTFVFSIILVTINHITNNAHFPSHFLIDGTQNCWATFLSFKRLQSVEKEKYKYITLDLPCFFIDARDKNDFFLS
jgi:hypothetical protein